MASRLPCFNQDLGRYIDPAFTTYSPFVACDLTEFLLMDIRIPSEIRKLYDAANSGNLDACDALYKSTRVVLVQHSVDFVGGITGTGKSIAAAGSVTVPVTINGGKNCIVLGVRATCYQTGTSTSLNTDLLELKDQDTNPYTWIESTPLTNVAGTAGNPGLVYPQRWPGQLIHNITIKNNLAVTADVRLSYLTAQLYLIGA